MSARSAQTHNSNPRTDADAIQKIDEEIVELKARIASLKLARNALVPVARLHSEILQDIFFLAHTSSDRYSKGRTSLLITWVSHAWRELAHHTPWLWTHIDFIHPEWIEAAVAHASNRALEFNLTCRTREGLEHGLDYREEDHEGDVHEEDLAPRCLRHLSRIARLKIRSGARSDHFQRFNVVWRLPAPILVELHLIDVILPNNLFSGTCPSLKVLILAFCPVDWDSFFITPHLKKLSIRFPTTRAPVATLVRILQGTTSTLEELILASTLSRSSHNHLTLNRLQLIHLKVLQVDEREPGHIKGLLDQLELPSLINTKFTTKWPDQILAEAILSSRNISRWQIYVLQFRTAKNGLPAIQITEDVRDGEILHSRNTSKDRVDYVKTIFDVGVFDLPNIFAYFGTLTTVDIINFPASQFKAFVTVLEEQNNQLFEAVGSAEEVNSVFDVAAVARGRDIIWFHNLQAIEIGGQQSPNVSREEYRSLERWLTYRKKVGLELESLFIIGVRDPLAGWIQETFEDLVGELELIDGNAVKIPEIGNDGV
ncbi:hypothetical protein BDN72DRAFT_879624 [Pluteus cervinus]|uniref:Uncharacterized protein n=1 Tax=Pluteus cervinus TaxID=181527 RepID=A0ACD3AP11_9AGAR|nr:hypothetical protein BDN72DRAFT_879624 [Pluteus cervinus]